MNKDMISSKSKKISWSNKLKSSFTSKYGNSKKDGKEVSLCEKQNVNEEYKEVFRTKSYIEIWSKAQVQLTGLQRKSIDENHCSSCSPSTSSSRSNSFSCSSSSNTTSPLPFYIHLSELLLEPRQEAVIDIINSSNLQSLVIEYFDASLEAYNICEFLLKGIHKTRSNHRIIKRVIKLYQGREDKEGHLSKLTNEQSNEILLKELASFASLRNPLSKINNGAVDFRMIHERYGKLLRNLTLRKRKIKRKEKFTRFYKKAVGYGFVITYAVLAVALLVLAMHTMVGLLGASGLLIPLFSGIINKVKGGGSLKINLLKHLGSQLDVAARGVYTFINDFDTVGRLVTRLNDEVEHKRQTAEICVRNGRSHEVIKEAIRDMQMHEQGFVEQLDELEEHIYLCFLTINRSRRLVLQEILAPLT